MLPDNTCTEYQNVLSFIISWLIQHFGAWFKALIFREFFNLLTNSKQNQNFNWQGHQFYHFLWFSVRLVWQCKNNTTCYPIKKKKKCIWLFSQEFHCFCLSSFPVSTGNCIPTQCPGNLNDFCGSNGDNYLSNRVTDVMIYETGKHCFLLHFS